LPSWVATGVVEAGYFFFDDFLEDFLAAGFFLAATRIHPRSVLCVHDFNREFKTGVRLDQKYFWK
jgi:hypothetical protein